MKHWAQSMLLGVPVSLSRPISVYFHTPADCTQRQNVEVGFRDNRGIIQQVQRFETMRIPGMLARFAPTARYCA